ncbi:hypothetical protein CBR_g8934 [Chara braunii]|uniref:CCHC-type domain-containing protein n=1 Tax=Chara braunii TaxID=69332 RepID=A0A388KNA5_CHABU|nr:hypothetical protein CBR_g8934 [Chara braunii]|eukprot:GBG71517.1 hypothetical protein CBR_g8934 [Chara braunii]
MAGGGYRGFGRDQDRDRYQDIRRDYGSEEKRERTREVRGDRQREYDRGPYYEWSQDYREQPRRSAPVCFECGEPGHYRNQCPRLVGEGSSRVGMIRGRSLSPNRQPPAHGKRSMSEDLVAKQQLVDLASSIASMREIFDREQEKKNEKARRKQEKKEKEEREKEERLAAKRREEKEEKLRREEKERERFPKEMRIMMQISMDLGGLREHLQRKIDRVIALAKGKGKAEATHSDADSYESGSSDVEALSNQAERLVMSEKRKRGQETVVGDSPPMKTPTKRSAKQGTPDPLRRTKRLQLSCRRPPMKKTPSKMTPQRSVGMNKIPASVGPMGKLKFVTENLKVLGNMTMDQLKEVCRLEDVQFETKKMETILAIADKRAQIAYGSDQEDVEEHEVGHEDPAAEEVAEPEENEGDEYWSSFTYVDGAQCLILRGKPRNAGIGIAVSGDQETGGLRAFRLLTQGGNNWCGGWKSIKSAFGNSVVKVDGQRRRLHNCKRLLEQGTDLEICQLRRWKPKIGPDKKFFVTILRNPGDLAKLPQCNLEALVRLMDAAKDFQRASTTAYLRRHIARAIKTRYWWSINSRIIVRLRYDDRIKVVQEKGGGERKMKGGREGGGGEKETKGGGGGEKKMTGEEDERRRRTRRREEEEEEEKKTEEEEEEDLSAVYGDGEKKRGRWRTWRRRREGKHESGGVGGGEKKKRRGGGEGEKDKTKGGGKKTKKRRGGGGGGPAGFRW